MDVLVHVVDDTDAVLESAAERVGQLPEAQLVGTARSGREALGLVESLHPHLVLLDLVLPDISGLGVTRQLKRWPSPPFVAIMTLHDGPEYRAAALEAGADAYLATEAFDRELPALVRAVARRLRSEADARATTHG